jgi:ADP-heptose:LPS heptosyltransferase
VTELWGLGDLALAMPFLQTAVRHTQVTLLAKPHAGPLLKRFAPEVELVEFEAPWTAFKGKYRLQHWPWKKMRRILHDLKARHFSAAVSARPDPREHFFLRLTRADQVVGFPRTGSGLLLNHSLPPPQSPHRADFWHALLDHWQWKFLPADNPPVQGRHVVIHTGAAQAVRRWPAERYAQVAAQLQKSGWTVTIIDESQGNLNTLIATLSTADRFIGNDSGPGHIAALLGVPTFTIFGPQLSEHFAPQHPRAAWINGANCPHKPCHDYCLFERPHCLLDLTFDDVWSRIATWII